MKGPALATAILLVTFALAAAAGDIRVVGKFVSTVPNGTPPLEVTSATRVDNLNADTVDGFHGTDFYTVTELAMSGLSMVHFDNITDIPTDGVKNINQDCASGAGCFAGDNVGFPVEITEPGSYRLTSNLDLTSLSSPENRDGVSIEASNVTLDLNGFAIVGAITCTGTPVTSWTATGSGSGVAVDNATEGTVIRNGSVKGFGADGITCNHECLIEDIFATENGFTGIKVNNGRGIVRNCRSFRNGLSGITGGGTIEGSKAEGNLDYGIFSQPGSIVKDNYIANNGGNGIRCFSCLATGNTVKGNGGHGMEFGGESGYGGNVIVDNVTGNVTGSALQLSTNVCNGGGACP